MTTKHVIWWPPFLFLGLVALWLFIAYTFGNDASFPFGMVIYYLFGKLWLAPVIAINYIFIIYLIIKTKERSVKFKLMLNFFFSFALLTASCFALYAFSIALSGLV